jgi:hypothetical protein
MGQPRADDMDGQQRRDQKSDDQLGRLPGGHPQAAPPIQRPQRQPEMNGQRSVEDGGPDRVAPQPEERPAPVLHGLERDDAEGVVGEMSEQENEQDEPGREPQQRRDAAGFDHARVRCRMSRETRAVQSRSGVVIDSADRIRAIIAPSQSPRDLYCPHGRRNDPPPS